MAKRTVRQAFLPIACLLLLVALLPAVSAGETVRFTVQPKGGTAINYEDFIITWKTEPDVRVMLQMRSSDTEDWGNVDWITSPHKLNMFNFSSQYRLSAETDGDEVYSDVFVVTWEMPAEITTADVSVPSLSDLPLGYASAPVLPVRVTNTGAYPITKPFIELGSIDTAVELIQNREPVTILPGETDESTWSVRPLPGLGIGWYETGIYLMSPNLDPYAEGAYANVSFEVVESDVDITYVLACDDVYFGRLEVDYPEQDTFDLTVRNVGTGNVTNVHIYTEDSDTSFFHLYRNVFTVEQLNAGMDTGTSWYVRLNGGLDTGVYETDLKVYADELPDPLLIHLRAEIVGPGAGNEIGGMDGDPLGGSTAQSRPEGELTQPGTASGPESAVEPVSADPASASVPTWVWVLICAAGLLLAAVIVLTVLLVRKKGKRE